MVNTLKHVCEHLVTESENMKQKNILWDMLIIPELAPNNVNIIFVLLMLEY